MDHNGPLACLQHGSHTCSRWGTAGTVPHAPRCAYAGGHKHYLVKTGLEPDPAREGLEPDPPPQLSKVHCSTAQGEPLGSTAPTLLLAPLGAYIHSHIWAYNFLVLAEPRNLHCTLP
jgi:hypothetical protein